MIEDRKQFGQLLKDKKLNGYGVELGVAMGNFSNHLLNTSPLKVPAVIIFCLVNLQ